MLEKSMNQEPNLINQESLLIYLGEDVNYLARKWRSNFRIKRQARKFKVPIDHAFGSILPSTYASFFEVVRDAGNN